MQAQSSSEKRFAELQALLDTAKADSEQRGCASHEHAKVVEALRALGRHDDAGVLLTSLMELRPGSPADHEALGFAAFQAGMHELSRAFYARVVEAVPTDAMGWYNLASSDRNLGRLAEAEQACDRALNLAPQMAQAALLRSQLRTQTANRNHVDHLRAMLVKAPASQGQDIFLHYALGKELDDLGDYDAAFVQFTLGAEARRRLLNYDVGQDLLKLRRISESFGRERLSVAPPLAEPRYGFILGLPRSGTTMIERMLTGNEHARSNGETDNLFGALNEAMATGEGDVFDRVAGADPIVASGAYARRAGRPGPRQLILEKLPFNYLYAGAIRLVLPNARTLLVRRAPADNCFAMFSTLFGSGYPFSYTLTELADYYCGYHVLMSHWHEVLGEQLAEVAYEDVVSDPKGMGQAIAAHFGLAWSDDMASIEKNRTGSATASAVQVRRPIYSTARGRWRNYARHLEPLMERLEQAGIDPEVASGYRG